MGQTQSKKAIEIDLEEELENTEEEVIDIGEILEEVKEGVVLMQYIAEDRKDEILGIIKRKRCGCLQKCKKAEIYEHELEEFCNKFTEEINVDKTITKSSQDDDINKHLEDSSTATISEDTTESHSDSIVVKTHLVEGCESQECINSNWHCFFKSTSKTQQLRGFKLRITPTFYKLFYEYMIFKYKDYAIMVYKQITFDDIIKYSKNKNMRDEQMKMAVECALEIKDNYEKYNPDFMVYNYHKPRTIEQKFRNISGCKQYLDFQSEEIAREVKKKFDEEFKSSWTCIGALDKVEYLKDPIYKPEQKNKSIEKIDEKRILDDEIPIKSDEYSHLDQYMVFKFQCFLNRNQYIMIGK